MPQLNLILGMISCLKEICYGFSILPQHLYCGVNETDMSDRGFVKMVELLATLQSWLNKLGYVHVSYTLPPTSFYLSSLCMSK